MTAFRLAVGDVLDGLAHYQRHARSTWEWPDLIFTSPPFLALRSYLHSDDPLKALEHGSEATPADWLDVQLRVIAACGDLLAPHGSLVWEVGDTYAGSGGAGGDYNEGGLRDGQPRFRAGTARWDGRPEGQVRTTTSDPTTRRNGGGSGWPDDKCLALVPQLLEVALAYGINPLTGAPSPAGRWRIRNVVVWARPNPPVGALADKCRPSYSHVIVATKARDRWWDMEPLRVPSEDEREFTRNPRVNHKAKANPSGWGFDVGKPTVSNPAGRPLYDVWEIPTEPYPGSHYATMASEVARRAVLLMCPPWVCRTCGQPRRRIVETEYVQSRNGESPAFMAFREGARVAGGVNNFAAKGSGDGSVTAKTTTLGWTDCGHDDYRPGITLDPYLGAGTTAATAIGNGRWAWGCELDRRNLALIEDRVGPLIYHQGDIVTVTNEEAA